MPGFHSNTQFSNSESASAYVLHTVCTNPSFEYYDITLQTVQFFPAQCYLTVIT